MCQKYCLENGIVTVREGESVITADVHGTYTGFIDPKVTAKDEKARRRHVPNGATILICEVPEQIRTKHGVQKIETITFVETKECPYDFVKFESVADPVPLKEFGFGVRFDIMVLKDQPAPEEPRLSARELIGAGTTLVIMMIGFSMFS